MSSGGDRFHEVRRYLCNWHGNGLHMCGPRAGSEVEAASARVVDDLELPSEEGFVSDMEWLSEQSPYRWEAQSLGITGEGGSWTLWVLFVSALVVLLLLYRFVNGRRSGYLRFDENQGMGVGLMQSSFFRRSQEDV
mmetsp:Transcript_33621/g.52307  ORF Transcript_33621/g.52307 Transcript_33621/m.52307 type:complete len:136 (+) Transcript_33621:234-641(+)